MPESAGVDEGERANVPHHGLVCMPTHDAAEVCVVLELSQRTDVLGGSVESELCRVVATDAVPDEQYTEPRGVRADGRQVLQVASRDRAEACGGARPVAMFVFEQPTIVVSRDHFDIGGGEQIAAAVGVALAVDEVADTRDHVDIECLQLGQRLRQREVFAVDIADEADA